MECPQSSALATKVSNITFRNPLGLAAGFDKNGNLVSGIDSLGFGFVEIGTITPRPQEGNPRPRIERIPQKEAILNRMGFNNDGMDVIATRVRNNRHLITASLGINIGKNKDTPNDQAIGDYEKLFRKFLGLTDFFTVNISSPNTKGLRDLQSGDFLTRLADKIKLLFLHQPVFIKLSAEIDDEALFRAGALCGKDMPYAGLILCNTIPTDLGGISGRPLTQKSLELLAKAKKSLPQTASLISVGGIFSPADAIARLDAGADAVELYTGLIYEGPGLIDATLHEMIRYRREKAVTKTK